MADVLRALEHPEGQAAEEVPGREQAGCRPQLETGFLWEERRNAVRYRAMELRDTDSSTL